MEVVILFCATFVLKLIFGVLVGSLHEDFGEDPGFWTHINSTRLKISVAHVNYFHAHFSTTLIGLFSVLGCCLDRDWTVYHLRIFCILEPLRLCREGNLVSLLSFLLLEREGRNTQAHIPFSFANFPRGHTHTKLIQY